MGGGPCQGDASPTADTHMGTRFDVQSVNCDIAEMEPQVRVGHVGRKSSEGPTRTFSPRRT